MSCVGEQADPVTRGQRAWEVARQIAGVRAANNLEVRGRARGKRAWSGRHTQVGKGDAAEVVRGQVHEGLAQERLVEMDEKEECSANQPTNQPINQPTN